MQNFDVLTLVFFGLAVFVVFKLRSVLGTRTGEERPRDLFKTLPQNDSSGEASGNVIPMPGRNAPQRENPQSLLDGVVPAESPARAGLTAILEADSSFNPEQFIGGARSAYEMIVLAFANGDRRTLDGLLAPDVLEGFAKAIAEREARGEKVETQFVSIDKSEITDALLRTRTAQITVRFASKLITATRNSAGEVIDGSAEKVVDVIDIWTFARDTSARDPNWHLVATESV